MAKTVELQRFYASREWAAVRDLAILRAGGRCQRCGWLAGSADEMRELIGHHVRPLTMETLSDPSVRSNPENVEVLCRRCHSRLHAREGAWKPRYQVWIVWGAPLSGKSLFVRERALPGDLVVDLDLIWAAVSGAELYDHAEGVRGNAFAVRNLLIDQARTRTGRWDNAWIVGTYPYRAERLRLADRLGAECVLIEAERDVCLRRAAAERPAAWIGYVHEWFDRAEV